MVNGSFYWLYNVTLRPKTIKTTDHCVLRRGDQAKAAEIPAIRADKVEDKVAQHGISVIFPLQMFES